MDSLGEDQEGQAALDALIAAIDGNILDLVLQPGDCVFVDNHRAVHGRRPFKARFNGYDRWLKRINLTRDLQKSRGSRCSCTSRIIY
jgi:alpha-ketoglutarate-dependent taurine dioxygenase